MTELPGLTHLGGATTYRYDHPEASILEAFPKPRPGAPWVVELDCGEFTSLCPMTGQPDFGRIHILYVPRMRCVESKSLKLYLGAFRNHGAFHEECVNQIADDLAATIEPQWLRVFGNFAARGGIAIRPLALREDPELSPEDRAVCLGLIAQHDAVTRRRAT